jgi:hypothetical protein
VAVSGEVDDGRGVELLRGYRAWVARGPAVRGCGPSTGKVGGAKNPKKWGNFFDFRASYAEAPKPGGRISPVRITLPDGEVVSNDQADLEQILFGAFRREIAFVEARAEQMT